MEGNRLACLKKLIGSSYKIMSRQAWKEENLSKWKPSSMTTQIVSVHDGEKVEISDGSSCSSEHFVVATGSGAV